VGVGGVVVDLSFTLLYDPIIIAEFVRFFYLVVV
jgi:hypothetical protein